jgi:hypothetical protein
VPQAAEKSLIRFFCGRLLDSWHLPFGVLKYYDWQRRPTGSRFWAGVKVLDGPAFLSAVVEWPKVKDVLDAGGLAPLGLVTVGSFDPRQMARHHQVLAYGYEQNGNSVVLDVYDPNYPNDDALTLTVDRSDPDADRMIVHGREGPIIRGIFLTEYAPVDPRS